MDLITNVTLQPLTESMYIKPQRMTYTQDGKEKTWDLTFGHDSVAVLIHNVTRDVFVFVKQFRPAVYFANARKCGALTDDRIDTSLLPGSAGVTVELCAGIIDKDKPREEIAQEEILEECGYNVPVEKLEKIIAGRAGVGVKASHQTMYYAPVTDSMKVNDGGGNVSEGEMIELMEIPVKDSLQFVMGESYERPNEMAIGIMWYFMNKQNSR